jgi:hypothetical protein
MIGRNKIGKRGFPGKHNCKFGGMSACFMYLITYVLLERKDILIIGSTIVLPK